jgi:hypothetical protein
MADNAGYRIGYGKPPLHSRFRKGQSGNKRGRPRGRLDFAARLQKALLKSMMVNERGVRKQLQAIDVAIQQQINKAAAGDIKAFRLLASLIRELTGSSEGNAPFKIVISETDSKL